MIELAWTPNTIDPTAKDANGNFIAHQHREYERAKSMQQAERLVKKLISDGAYDIFIDIYDRDGDLKNFKSYNLKT